MGCPKVKYCNEMQFKLNDYTKHVRGFATTVNNIWASLETEVVVGLQIIYYSCFVDYNILKFCICYFSSLLIFYLVAVLSCGGINVEIKSNTSLVDFK